MPSPSLHDRTTSACVPGAPWSCTASVLGPGTVRLAMLGDLDLVSAEAARQALQDAQDAADHVVCDLARSAYVDLRGLRVLLDAAARARRDGTRLTVIRRPTGLRRMLDVLDLEALLDADPTERSAPAASPERPRATTVVDAPRMASRRTRPTGAGLLTARRSVLRSAR